MKTAVPKMWGNIITNVPTIAVHTGNGWKVKKMQNNESRQENGNENSATMSMGR
jgi:hypothetical protein